ncbi:hypothetical protein ACCO45_004512 [Purpureocillium lilacinum]|uniref:Uncharacterized protein n=1 Tax=Purpureocillium lilacinum TaxID=33203 RepID=A0ACC4E2Y3_PURLI
MPIYRAQSFTTLRRGRKLKLDTSEYCLSVETKLAEAEIRHKSLLAALQHRNEEVKRLRMLIDRLTKDVHHRRVEALSMCWRGSTPETPIRAMCLENGAPPRAYRDGGENGSFPQCGLFKIMQSILGLTLHTNEHKTCTTKLLFVNRAQPDPSRSTKINMATNKEKQDEPLTLMSCIVMEEPRQNT